MSALRADVLRRVPARAALVAAVLVTAAACGGGSSADSADSPTVAVPTDSASAAATAGSSGVSTAPSAAASSPAAAGSGSGSGSAAGSGGAGSGGGSTGSTGGSSTGSGGSGSGSSAGGGQQASGFTKPGTYTYDLSGKASSPFGDQNLDGTSTLQVDPVKGDTQHSVTSDKNGSQDQTVKVDTTGAYFTDIKLKMTGFNEEFAPKPPVLYFPAKPTTGRSWHWTVKSTDGKFTLAANLTISGKSSVTVGGKSQPATIVDSVLHITGQGIDFTVHQRDWASVSLALILKEHAVSNGKAYGATVSSDVTRMLRSTKPS